MEMDECSERPRAFIPHGDTDRYVGRIDRERPESARRAAKVGNFSLKSCRLREVVRELCN